MNWQDLQTVRKGNIGEKVVKDYLMDKGYIPYIPDAPGSHPFDLLVASPNKRQIFIADSKAKPARIYYPDTGIDLRHYNQYSYIEQKHNMNVFVFFVDEDNGKVYGNFLKKLTEPVEIEHNGKVLSYPKTETDSRGITTIYFPLEKMLPVGDIPEDDISRLRELSQRNHSYQR